MAMRHPGGAENLQPAEKRMHCARREAMERNKKQKHEQAAQDEAGDGRGNHW